jgi:hypothetical protein
MDTLRFDSLAKTLSSGLDRRRAAKGLGGLALGALGLGVARGADARNRDRDNDNEKARRCKKQCERRCENRDNPGKCRQDCRDRRCRRYED